MRLTIGPIADVKAWKADALRRIDDRPVLVSVSGGKDSTAVALLLIEAEIPFRAIHMDTGWEHPSTVDYVKNDLPKIVGPITTLRSKHGGMEELIRKKGLLPSRVRKWCTHELKLLPFRDYVNALDDETVNAVGIRAAESKRRAGYGEWEHSDNIRDAPVDCWLWRPILRFSFEDVISLHQHHGVKPNPLYLKQGVERVGCWPCINSRKAEIRMVSEQSPETIDKIEELEAFTEEAIKRKLAARGLKPRFDFPKWFYVNKRPVPIREAVAWSKTARGGKQAANLELFDDGRDGCMRWGMCESVPEDAK